MSRGRLASGLRFWKGKFKNGFDGNKERINNRKEIQLKIQQINTSASCNSREVLTKLGGKFKNWLVEHET